MWMKAWDGSLFNTANTVCFDIVQNDTDSRWVLRARLIGGIDVTVAYGADQNSCSVTAELLLAKLEHKQDRVS